MIYRCSGILAVLFVLLSLSVRSEVSGTEASALLNRADSLYKVQRFAEAGSIYQELFNAGYATPAALLRHANLNEGRGNIEEALASLYRYHRMTRDPVAYQKMVELAESKNLSGYEIPESEHIRLWLNQWSGIALPLLAGLTMLLVSLQFRLKRNNPARKSPGLAFALTVLVLLAFLWNNFTDATSKVTVRSDEVRLMAGPSAAADRGPLAKRGDLITVTGVGDAWVEVESGGRRYYARRHQIIFL